MAAKTNFRQWRRSRPFWAGLCTLASGLLILFPPYASLKFGDIVVSLNTLTGVSAMVIGVLLVCCGLSFWTRQEFRIPAGIVALLLSVAAIVTANLGSFLIGTLLGVVGAALGLAWTPKARQRKEVREPAQDTSARPVGYAGGHA
ncbi:DUF6114 domain-containing protein [Saccharopolyspora flava]|uniref:Uncharacterized protein n=1 Tax=Saccharopolyspora flava TaxID=95161 RepID=A0A1I6QKF8_9PSEU|nr:DUF6114 domain-containing protein [Saccharopolyspora flava]SFS52931.1 hypothetical protein SAMN05660874_01546 [Saccharopolyspora flava]